MSNWSNEEFISAVYQNLLNRNPDPEAMHHFADALSKGEDPKDFIRDILLSDEYTKRREGFASRPVNEELVRLLYRGLLNREPDAVGLDHFCKVLAEGADVRQIFTDITSGEEYKHKTRLFEDDPLHIGTKVHRPIKIVDVGAQKLASEDHIYASLTRNAWDWRCIGFEPQEDRLNERLQDEANPNLTMLNAFIGDGSDALFHLVNSSGSSSLLELNEGFNAAFDDIADMRVVSTEPVKTVTLDQALAGEEYVDFLKMDIQGFEFRALQGAADILKRTNVIHCEVLFAPQYKGASYFRDIDAFLSDAGFEFIDFSHINRYPYISVPLKSETRERLIWADAVFFKTAPLSRDDQLAQALIASVVYKKHGLAQSILGLNAHDGVS